MFGNSLPPSQCCSEAVCFEVPCSLSLSSSQYADLISRKTLRVQRLKTNSWDRRGGWGVKTHTALEDLSSAQSTHIRLLISAYNFSCRGIWRLWPARAPALTCIPILVHAHTFNLRKKTYLQTHSQQTGSRMSLGIQMSWNLCPLTSPYLPSSSIINGWNRHQIISQVSMPQSAHHTERAACPQAWLSPHTQVTSQAEWKLYPLRLGHSGFWLSLVSIWIDSLWYFSYWKIFWGNHNGSALYLNHRSF